MPFFISTMRCLFVFCLLSAYATVSQACTTDPDWLISITADCGESNASFMGVVSKQSLADKGVIPPSGDGYVAWCQYDFGNGQYGDNFYGVRVSCPSKDPDDSSDDDIKDCSANKHSTIKIDSRIVEESVPIVGTPFSANYSSAKADGKALKLVIGITGDTVHSSHTGTSLQVFIAGRTLTYSFPNPTPNQSFEFVWDGLDAQGNPVFGDIPVVMESSEEFSWFVNMPRARSNNYGVAALPTPAIPFRTKNHIYRPNIRQYGLGGWTLDVHHSFYPETGIIYLGNGDSYKANPRAIPNGFLVISSDGSEAYEFINGRHTTTLNGLKGTVKYTFGYDSNGYLISITDAFANLTTIDHDTNGNPTQITGPYGQITNLATNAHGFLSSITNPKNEAVAIQYYTPSGQPTGLLHTFQKPGGAVATMTYDTAGNLVSDSSTSGGGITLSATDRPGGDLVTTLSAEGILETYDNKNLGNGVFRRAVTYNSQGTSQYDFRTNPNGLLAGYNGNDHQSMFYDVSYGNDPRFGDSVRFESNNTKVAPMFGIAKTISKARSATTNAGGLFDVATLIENTNINGKTYQTVYDGATSKFTTTSPAGRISTRTIDSNERVTMEQVGNLRPMRYFYDSRGRVTRVNHGGRITDYAYNAKGYLKFIKNALNQETNFTYDNAGQVTTKTLPDGSVAAFTYDSNGNMTSVSPPGKPAHLMTYNDFDLLETYLPTTPTTYEYNNDRKVTRITRPDMSVIDYTYSATTGRLTNIQTPSGNYTFVPNSLWQYEDQATSPDGVVNTFTHNGELVTSVATSGPTTGTISYTYNNNFLVSSYQVLNGAAVSYTFDNDMLPITIGDAVLTRNIITGAVKRVKVGRVIEQIDRNPFGELESLESRHGGTNANFYTTAFTRDDLGRISTKVETKQANTPVTYSYAYDLNGRLTDVVRDGITIGHYEYDLNGNRTLTTQLGVNTSATYNDLDQLLTFGTKNYTYSANGEVAAVTDSAAIPMGSVSYTYDSFGVLKSATLPNGNVISYLHDSQGRPVARKVNGAIQKQYVWLDGLKLAAELDSSGSVVLQFVYGTKENVPDYLIKAGIKYKLVTDHLGSVVMVIKTTNGVVVQEIAYDEFGRELSNTNPGFQPFGFAGGIYDSDTKLVHFGARDYDAETGRWTTKDPIRFAGGDFNLYGYVLGDPVNFVDPGGESWIKIGAIIIGAIVTHFTIKQVQKEYQNDPDFRNFINNQLPDPIRDLIDPDARNEQYDPSRQICRR